MSLILLNQFKPADCRNYLNSEILNRDFEQKYKRNYKKKGDQISLYLTFGQKLDSQNTSRGNNRNLKISQNGMILLVMKLRNLPYYKYSKMNLSRVGIFTADKQWFLALKG